ncbi:esterase [Nissabacter sp. SGAir0207]|uniref:esterase n=1 Tax=Nissabacter sp. SGAir0207 TaxID=2126321 RepID=UPI0010CD0C26|nr:esterase [Nissabacter sp. SGAir0207]QCR36122.1 esterase [Nissabacter sp. SGAir0207]
MHVQEFLPDEAHAGPPQQLMVLLHGAGGQPDDVGALVIMLRQHWPAAAIVVPEAPEIFDAEDADPGGRQWFSGRDMSEHDLVARVGAALPPLLDYIREAQRRLALTGTQTALIGMDQGAIMALEASAREHDIAGRVVAFSGRFATLPTQAAPAATLHLLHGGADPVIEVRHAQSAFSRLEALGADATLDIAWEAGHELNAELLACAIDLLQSYVPQRLWREALSIVPQATSGTRH